MKTLLTTLVIAIVTCATPAQMRVPRQERDRVIYDYADVLTPQAEESVKKILMPLFQVKRPIVILTVQSLADYDATPAKVIDFATLVYNAWQLGSPTSGNMGALIVVSKGDRKMAIEVGEGVTRNRSDQVQSIIDDVIGPNFKENDYEGGLREGALAIRDRVFQPTTDVDLANLPVEGTPSAGGAAAEGGGIGLPGPAGAGEGRQEPRQPDPGGSAKPPQSPYGLPGFNMNFDCGKWFCLAIGVLLLISMFRRRRQHAYGYGPPPYGGQPPPYGQGGYPPPPPYGGGYGHHRYGRGGGLGGMLGGILTGMLINGMNRRSRGGGRSSGGSVFGGGGSSGGGGGGGSVFGGGGSSSGGGGGGFGAGFGGGTASGRGASGSW